LLLQVSVVQSIENARHNHGGTLKANMHANPMHRLAESLMACFAANEKQPPGIRQPTTTKLIVAKGLEARKKLLELHEIQPFLDPKEKKALENFTGSDSWAKKFAKRHNLKMSGARVRIHVETTCMSLQVPSDIVLYPNQLLLGQGTC
jgi:hypothetical protein